MLAFASPWFLTALLGLPILWLILRVTPPSPRILRFPAIRLLYNLQSRENTPDSAPWWLLLLRLTFAVLAILALAGPILNAIPTLPGNGAVVVVIDDGWASGHHWTQRQRSIIAVIAQAERQDRILFLLPTSGQGGSVKPLIPGEAKAMVKRMVPQPWSVDLESFTATLAKTDLPKSADVVWFTNGIADTGETDLAGILQRLGSLTIVTAGSAGPKVLMPPENSGRNIDVVVVRTTPGAAETAAIRAIAANDRILTRREVQFSADQRETTARISLPIDIRNEVSRLELEGENTAAAVILLDEGFRRQSVGLIAETGFQRQQPLLDELYYLERALAPFGEVNRGTLDDLIDAGTSNLILPDTGVLPQADKTRLVAWIEAGGILVRFAGPRLAAAGFDSKGLDAGELIPVRLRHGDRAMGGALSWSKPLAITDFSPQGPFAGMDTYGEVVVRRQVLAEPAIDLDEHSWAKLADGTPIVTAEARGQGWLILFHTTATPDWSELALSGLFVDMLRQIVALGTAIRPSSDRGEILQPLENLDGFGDLGQPLASARAIRLDAANPKPVIGPRHPPGYYGTPEAHRAVNLTITPDRLGPEPAPAAGISQRSFMSTSEIEFRPALFAAATILFLLDLLVTLFMRGHLSPRRGPRQAVGLALTALAFGNALTIPNNPSKAQSYDPDAFAQMASGETHLAYVVTGIDDVDAVSEAGLSSLSGALRSRTAVEPGTPIGVQLERDELAFFPLLYWPIPPDHPPLSDLAAERVNTFMHNGGTVLFDTRDQFEASVSGYGSGMQRLRTLSHALEIPALTPVPTDHVLTKSFYLLSEFPGRFEGGLVWIRDGEDETNSEVTPIIVGSHDWSGAWARSPSGLFAFPVIPGGELQREQAFRFGINLVMYALTGNYKADQVHVPSILERLSQ